MKQVRQSLFNSLALLFLLAGVALIFFWVYSARGAGQEPVAGQAAQADQTPLPSPSLLPAPTMVPSPTATPSPVPSPTAPFPPPLFTPTPWSLNPDVLTVAPLYPGLDEPVTVTISGHGPADCQPVFMSYERLDTGYVPVELVEPAGSPCTEPEAPWIVTTTIAPLPPGHWLLEVFITTAAGRARYAAQSLYVAPPGPTPVVTPTAPGDFPSPTPYFYYPERLSFTVAAPTSAEVLQLTVQGKWPAGCVPTLAEITMDPPFVRIWLAAPYLICSGAQTPWSEEVSVGPLPAGRHYLEVYVEDSTGTTLYAAQTIIITE